ncbi:family 3 adenylate cyclase [Mycolicibacterium rhodesiae NBB3]|uniref:Family 3 adenylate cyclase n=1 Tax=Mycolicibacterium rhodesiae (strain NBB3) TaxID=710685 RepID=G8RME2_MYCRN|nr:adenylate/guanylate cyclase domain-containing protein [Mycolicibacterium rhodesiae]AEV72439.1 family 3 adenylate cyclase [Mycolicibacterium rhodesiae NBB3]
MSRAGYARTKDGAYIAYREWGEKDPAHVFLSEWAATVDTRDMHPSFIRLWRQLGSISRVVSLDRRGLGTSDPVVPPRFDRIDEFAEDVLAVMDALQIDRVALTGEGSSAIAAAYLAVHHPDRILRVALVNTAAKSTRTDDYPIALLSDEDIRVVADAVESTWGDGSFVAAFSTLASDPTFLEACGRVERFVCGPSAAAAYIRSTASIDIRELVTHIAIPTLVYYTGDLGHTNVEQSRDLAARIPDARLIEVPGKLFYQPDGNPQLDEYADFIGGHIDPDPTKHATVMFLDIVGSTELAESVGDASWAQTLDDLDGFVRREVSQRAGRVANFTGDGHLAVFDRAEDALLTALHISRGVHALGVEVRMGLHTGDVTVRSSGDIGGLTVHIGARVMSMAGMRQIFVSEATAERAGDPSLTFADRGVHQLKGVSGEYRILEITGSQSVHAHNRLRLG